MVLPVVETKKMQHTPKPDAQLPLAVPPLLLHSLDVKQVPFRTELCPDVIVLWLLHPVFLNCTIEKSENIFPVLFCGELSSLEDGTSTSVCALMQHKLANMKMKIVVVILY